MPIHSYLHLFPRTHHSKCRPSARHHAAVQLPSFFALRTYTLHQEAPYKNPKFRHFSKLSVDSGGGQTIIWKQKPMMKLPATK
eukprot:2809153-Ditylum_brightwellii.AAC.1